MRAVGVIGKPSNAHEHFESSVVLGRIPVRQQAIGQGPAPVAEQVSLSPGYGAFAVALGNHTLVEWLRV